MFWLTSYRLHKGKALPNSLCKIDLEMSVNSDVTYKQDYVKRD